MDEITFKKGYVVRCIDEYPPEIIYDHEYTLASDEFISCGSPHVTVLDEYGKETTWFKHRFVLVDKGKFDYFHPSIDYLKITREVCGG